MLLWLFRKIAYTLTLKQKSWKKVDKKFNFNLTRHTILQLSTAKMHVSLIVIYMDLI